jgi:hypothetical protein
MAKNFLFRRLKPIALKTFSQGKIGYILTRRES